MTVELQRDFNREGRKKKNKFKDIEGILMSPIIASLTGSTYKEIEDTIAVYLTNSRDRSGGRKIRLQRKDVSESAESE